MQLLIRRARRRLYELVLLTWLADSKPSISAQLILAAGTRSEQRNSFLSRPHPEPVEWGAVPGTLRLMGGRGRPSALYATNSGLSASPRPSGERPTRQRRVRGKTLPHPRCRSIPVHPLRRAAQMKRLVGNMVPKVIHQKLHLQGSRPRPRTAPCSKIPAQICHCHLALPTTPVVVFSAIRRPRFTLERVGASLWGVTECRLRPT